MQHDRSAPATGTDIGTADTAATPARARRPARPPRRALLRTAGAGAAGAALAALGAPSRVHAQGEVVKMLVGYPAGGAVDVAARALAAGLQKALGAQIVIENRTGASGTIPVGVMLQAPADGTTIMFSPPDAPIILPLTSSSIRYKTTDLAPISQVAAFSFAIGAGKASPATDFPSFVAWCKANPEAATYGTPGVGSSMHFLGEELARLSGAPLRHVPYRGGAQAIVDVTGGQIAALISTAPILVPQHQAGRIRVLAVTSRTRYRQLPEVPTFTELGLDAMNEDSWFGLFAHRDTPAPILERVAQAARAAVESEAFGAAMSKVGFEPSWAGVPAFSATVRERSARWAERVRNSAIRT
ncbi:MAG: Bug family tripartite tricarboxylate transporter substrate binding protein [Lautropia sp.]